MRWAESGRKLVAEEESEGVRRVDKVDMTNIRLNYHNFSISETKRNDFEKGSFLQHIFLSYLTFNDSKFMSFCHIRSFSESEYSCRATMVVSEMVVCDDESKDAPTVSGKF